jgi:hypothetical protein
VEHAVEIVGMLQATQIRKLECAILAISNGWHTKCRHITSTKHLCSLHTFIQQTSKWLHDRPMCLSMRLKKVIYRTVY